MGQPLPTEAQPVPLAGSCADTPTTECPMQIAPPQPRRSLIGEAIALAMMLAPLAALIGWAG